MKTKMFTYVMAAIIALPMFQSCKSDQTFAKRKYTKHHIKKDKRASIDKPEKLYFHEEFANQENHAVVNEAKITAEISEKEKVKENNTIEAAPVLNEEKVTTKTTVLTPSKIDKTVTVQEFAKVENVPVSAKNIEKNKTNLSSNLTLLEIVVAILLPPLAVGLFGGSGGDVLLNILLWILFYIPGLIHALIVLSKT